MIRNLISGFSALFDISKGFFKYLFWDSDCRDQTELNISMLKGSWMSPFSAFGKLCLMSLD